MNIVQCSSMRPRQYFFALLFAAFSSSAGMAQGRYLFQSTVVDEGMEAIGGAFVKNLRSNAYTVTDSLGLFSILCLPSDSLLISAMGYEIEIVKVNRMAKPFIQLRMILHRLRQIDVYEFGSWESFKKDFVSLEMASEEVNTTGLPKGTVSPKPVYLRPHTYESSPGLLGILTPASTITYLTSKKERDKRKVWKMMLLEEGESQYWNTMNADSIISWLPVPDSIVDDFIIYCNTRIKNRNPGSEAILRDEVSRQYRSFLNERHKKRK